MIATIEWKDNRVFMLDQSRLPIDIAYIECRDYLKVAEGIQKLWIRGAPAIGIAAAMGAAVEGIARSRARLRPADRIGSCTASTPRAPRCPPPRA